MSRKNTKTQCTNCNVEFLYDIHTSTGKYCSNSCQMVYQRLQKIADGTAGWVARKSYLKSLSDSSCEICGTKEWLGMPIMLITDHIDGNASNNELSNLRLICSNCDATLPTYKSRNNGNGRGTRKKLAPKA